MDKMCVMFVCVCVCVCVEGRVDVLRESERERGREGMIFSC